eukprot:Clim_evm96s157 gene=Clim_evmTU96s157
MTEIVPPSFLYSTYRDSQHKGQKPYDEALKESTTLYVGNLSFYTTEEQMYELFARCGDVKRIIQGLDRKKKTPCGFCFVEYYRRGDAEDCMKYLNGMKLDGRSIRTDWDAGFQEGRQYGRGSSGGQVRDEYRHENAYGSYERSGYSGRRDERMYDRRRGVPGRGRGGFRGGRDRYRPRNHDYRRY